jgi:hypothetical protein
VFNPSSILTLLHQAERPLHRAPCLLGRGQNSPPLILSAWPTSGSFCHARVNRLDVWKPTAVSLISTITYFLGISFGGQFRDTEHWRDALSQPGIAGQIGRWCCGSPQPSRPTFNGNKIRSFFINEAPVVDYESARASITE